MKQCPKAGKKNKDVKKRAISSEENTNVQTRQSSYQKETLFLEVIGNTASWYFYEVPWDYSSFLLALLDLIRRE